MMGELYLILICVSGIQFTASQGNFHFYDLVITISYFLGFLKIFYSFRFTSYLLDGIID